MSKSRGISKPVRCGTIRVDASYAEELVEFWTQKYEQVKEELDQIKVYGPRCDSEHRWPIFLTVATTLTRIPLLFLPRHLEVALAIGTRRESADPAPRRSSELRITDFPRKQLTLLFSEEGPGADALRACNEDLKDQLAASEKRRLELSQQVSARVLMARLGTNTLTETMS